MARGAFDIPTILDDYENGNLTDVRRAFRCLTPEQAASLAAALIFAAAERAADGPVHSPHAHRLIAILNLCKTMIGWSIIGGGK